MAYVPVKSNAGVVQFNLYYRATSALIKSFDIDVFNYSDTMNDSNLNEIFDNANYGITENYFGARPAINFSLVNNYQNPEYRQKILWLITMINDINNNPETYKLTILYRYPSLNYVILDAIQVGNIKLIEASGSSNSAQEIPFSFIDKSIGENVYGFSGDYPI